MDNKRKTSSIKFVGLHAHSVAGSPFDGMGYPQEHMEFAYENGSDALALTDHGNMNGLAYQVLHGKKMSQDGKDFKLFTELRHTLFPLSKSGEVTRRSTTKRRRRGRKQTMKILGLLLKMKTPLSLLLKIVLIAAAIWYFLPEISRALTTSSNSSRSPIRQSASTAIRE